MTITKIPGGLLRLLLMTASICPDIDGRWKMIVSPRRFTGPLHQALIKQLHMLLMRGGHAITDSQVIKISSCTEQPLAQERRPMFAQGQSLVTVIDVR